MADVKSILKNDIDRTIDGVIKADDREHMYQEVDEYVITREVAKHLDKLITGYRESIDIIRQGKSYPYDGVWISGYFGSGKSHLLKMLAYLLGNERVNGSPLAELFYPKIRDQLLKANLAKVVESPSESILFNIDQEADALKSDEDSALLSIFEKVFNRHLGYFPHNRNIAEFERHLDDEGAYNSFMDDYRHMHGVEWHQARSKCFGIGRSKLVAVLQKSLDMTEDDARAMIDQYKQGSSLSVESFVGRIHEWLEKKEDPGYRLNFFVDEVGQFVSGKSRLMLNLQTLAETFATVCRGRVWIFVTSQEDLTSVVGDPTAQQVQDYSKINARYHFRISLSSADVQEVIQKRLLDKTDEGAEGLGALYMKEKESFRTIFRFESGGRQISFRDKEQFTLSYPFQAYQYDLLQQSLIGLSEHNAFRGQHISRGERSMLEIFQDVTQRIKNEKLYTWATFDEMFEGIRQTLNTSLINAINTAERNLDNPLARRLLKILLMVKYVRTFRAAPDHLKILLIRDLGQDLKRLDKDIEEALNVLTHQTYIRKNGDAYEYLTNEEKDVEEEIKRMDVSHDDIRKYVSDTVFSGILKLTSSKLRDGDLKEDYAFKRLVNGELIGKNADLAIHIITPDHPNYDDRKTLLNQSMGKKEMTIILPPDAEFQRELRLYFQTDLYCRRQTGHEETSQIKRIINDKKEQNAERKVLLRDGLKDLMSGASVYVMGNELDSNASDPEARVQEGFKSLLKQAYPYLRFLGSHHYTEQDVKTTLYPDGDSALFTGHAAQLGEADEDMLTCIKREFSAHQPMSLKRLVEVFSAGQYGWYYWAVINILARLYAANRVELSQGNSIKSRDEVYVLLSGNRDFDQVRIKPVRDVTEEDLEALKELYRSLFHHDPSGGNAKEVAVDFKNGLLELTHTLEGWVASESASMPFLADLRPRAQRLREVCEMTCSDILEHSETLRDELIPLGMDELEPLQAFMTGTQKTVWQDCRDFLSANGGNLIEIGLGQEKRELEELIFLPPYKDGNLKKLKDLVRAAEEKLHKTVEMKRKEAAGYLRQLDGSMEALEGFQDLKSEDRERVRRPLRQLIDSVGKEGSLALIRDIKTNGGPRAMEQAQKEITGILHPKEEVVFATAQEKRVPFDKPVLATEEDVVAYAKALEQRYLKLVHAKKRITL